MKRYRVDPELAPFPLTITSYSPKGHGCGHHGKQIVEVPGSVMGDTLEVKGRGAHRHAWVGSIEKIIEPGADRVTPRCPHVGLCGGCTWQQISLKAQVRMKGAYVEKLLAPYLGELSFPKIEPCQSPFGYRNKMEYTFSQNIKGDRYLGLVIAETHGRVLNLEECHLAGSWQTAFLKELVRFWERHELEAYNPNKNRGNLRKIVIRESLRAPSLLINLFLSEALAAPLLEEFKEIALAAVPKEKCVDPSIFISLVHAHKGSPTEIFEMHLSGKSRLTERMEIASRKEPLTLFASPSAFLQPNTAEAERIYDVLAKSLNLTGAERVLDLYCGVGSIGMAIAPMAREVVGLEINRYAIFDGEEALKVNNIQNTRLFCGPANRLELILEREKIAKEFDIIIVDPPRAGLDSDTLLALERLNAPRLAYLSCNPESLARDLLPLTEQGYRLTFVQSFDPFPHTPHVETLAILTKIA